VSFFQGDEETDSFNPELTYSLYGEEEVIFGYQGLEISLGFAAHNLRPHVDVTFEKQFPKQGEVEANDVREPLREILPACAFEDISQIDALKDPDAAAFVPPGELLSAFKIANRTYEVWCASLADSRARQLVENVQIIVQFFIEGATKLELDYDWISNRWKVFLLYHIDERSAENVSRFIFAGYATSFRAYTFPSRVSEVGNVDRPNTDSFDSILSRWQANGTDHSLPEDAVSRERISQFVLLPSHRGSGLGSKLYSIMYKHLTSPESVVELTVEDPNTAFDDVRDVCDLIHLRSTEPNFRSLKLRSAIDNKLLAANVPIPTSDFLPDETLRQLTKTSKIQSRQLRNLIEMQLLSTIPKLNRSSSRITRREKSSNEYDRQFYFWRLFTKERIYQHNRDSLLQLDHEERIVKIDEAVDGLIRNYERILELVDKRMALSIGTEHSSQNGEGKKSRSRVALAAKNDDIDDDEAEEEQDEDCQPSRKKRKRVVDDDDD